MRVVEGRRAHQFCAVPTGRDAACSRRLRDPPSGVRASACRQAAQIEQRGSVYGGKSAVKPLSPKELRGCDEPWEVNRLLQQSVDEVAFPATDDEDWPERWVAAPAEQPRDAFSSGGCPVYVMLPLDSVRVTERNGRNVSVLKNEKALELALRMFKQSGVEGVMLDVWWGIVERSAPMEYDFSAYKRLFRKITAAGLKIQAVMSFHSAGGNVGDTAKVPLPEWVLEVGAENPDVFYTDKQGFRNREYLSLGCDEERVFHGRTPVEMYRDFVASFVSTFSSLIGTVISEITVGLGPAGELRYPSYPEGDGRWRFPGIGEFQCYDKYMLEDLRRCAEAAGHPQWGHGGPHDAGCYNSRSWETGFFASIGGRFDSSYGHFFLTWYSNMLLKHADRILQAVSEVINKRGTKQFLNGCQSLQRYPSCSISVKLAGIHWWFKTRSHAAELTAGYYNTADHDGYDAVFEAISKHTARMSFTCVEMRDCEHPPEAQCSPQGLLDQVVECSKRWGVRLSGENALQRYDEYGLSRIMESAFGANACADRLEQLTFLRMADVMFDNWAVFQSFVSRMKSPPGRE